MTFSKYLVTDGDVVIGSDKLSKTELARVLRHVLNTACATKKNGTINQFLLSIREAAPINKFINIHKGQAFLTQRSLALQ